MQIFGVYTYDNKEFGISNGNAIYWLFENQQLLDEDVDLNEGEAILTDYVVSLHGKDKIRIMDDVVAGRRIVAEYKVDEKVVEELKKFKKKMIGV
jgi:ribosomal protein L21